MEYIKFYCNNNNRELCRVSDYVINKYFGWLSQMYYDDFYSIANEVRGRCCENYRDDMGANFETYLINCLTKKFKTRITYMNRKRRNCGCQDVSLDAMIEERGTEIKDFACYDKEDDDSLSDKMTRYLAKLSELQRSILFLMADGYSVDEIKNALKITSAEISNACMAIRAYRNISVLY